MTMLPEQRKHPNRLRGKELEDKTKEFFMDPSNSSEAITSLVEKLLFTYEHDLKALRNRLHDILLNVPRPYIYFAYTENVEWDVVRLCKGIWGDYILWQGKDNGVMFGDNYKQFKEKHSEAIAKEIYV